MMVGWRWQMEMEFLACESALAVAEADVLQARLQRALRAQAPPLCVCVGCGWVLIR